MSRDDIFPDRDDGDERLLTPGDIMFAASVIVAVCAACALFVTCYAFWPWR